MDSVFVMATSVFVAFPEPQESARIHVKEKAACFLLGFDYEGFASVCAMVEYYGKKQDAFILLDVQAGDLGVALVIDAEGATENEFVVPPSARLDINPQTLPKQVICAQGFLTGGIKSNEELLAEAIQLVDQRGYALFGLGHNVRDNSITPAYVWRVPDENLLDGPYSDGIKSIEQRRGIEIDLTKFQGEIRADFLMEGDSELFKLFLRALQGGL